MGGTPLLCSSQEDLRLGLTAKVYPGYSALPSVEANPNTDSAVTAKDSPEPKKASLGSSLGKRPGPLHQSTEMLPGGQTPFLKEFQNIFFLFFFF